MKVTDPNLIAALNAPSGINEAMDGASPRVSDDMGIAPVQGDFANRVRDLAIAGERIRAGYGRGVATLAQGAKQLALHGGGALGIVDPKTVSDYDRQIADEADLYNADLGKTSAGTLGNFLGQGITTLPLGGLGGAAKAGIIASALRTGAQGAGLAALQPVEHVAQPQTLTDLVEGNAPEGQDYATAKLGQAVTGAAIGSLGNLGLRGLGAVAETARNLPTLPFRIKAGRAVTAASQDTPVAGPASDFIDESRRLSDATGVRFTPGQETGSKGLTTAEQKVRQSQKTADQAFAIDQDAAQALDDFVGRVASGVAKNGATPAEAGELVRTALSRHVKGLEAARRAQADVDYGAVRELTRGADVIEPQQSNAVLQKILSDNEGVGAKSSDALARFAKKQLANIDPKAKAAVDAASNPDPAQQIMNRFAPPEAMPSELAADAAATAPAQGNLDKLIKLRSYLSKVAGGQESISGQRADRMHARDLLTAIDADLKSAEGIGGQVGAALKKANANYRAYSQQMEYVNQSPLGKLLGEEVVGADGAAYNTIAPEKLFNRVQEMTPSELATTRALMQNQSPGSEFAGSMADAWQQMKRSVIEDALERARIAAPSKGANTLAMQPGEFVRALGQGKSQGVAWAKALFEPEELKQLNDAVGAARRLGDMTGYNFSGTAPALEQGVGEVAAAAAMGSKIGAARRAAGLVSELLTSKRLAAAMADPNGRKMLLRLQRLPPGSAKARELTASLSALTQSPDGGGEMQDTGQ